MTLTGKKLRKAFDELVNEYTKDKPCNLTKQDLKAAINAVDDWLDLQPTRQMINQVFPARFRQGATANDKISILLIVLNAKLRG